MSDIQANLALQDLRDELVGFAPVFRDKATMAKVNRAFRDHNLTLVLGAGVSSGLGFPMWNDLVDDLFRQIYRKVDPGLKTAPIKKLRKNGDTTNTSMIRHLENLADFRSTVRSLARNRLYRDFEGRGMRRVIKPICEAFLRKGLRSSVKDVITYNFDDVLERQLRAMGRSDVSTIYSGETCPQRRGGLRIYHPHGFLPAEVDDPGDKAFDVGVVFSERDYNLHFMDPSHWANIIQLQHFMNRTCLLIGISMTDLNMRRLLDHAHERTRSGIRHVSIQKTKGDAIADFYVQRDLQSLGITTLWVKDYDDIPGVLRNCAKS